MTGQVLTDRVLTRLGDNPAAAPSNQHYSPQEVLAALNMCQRMFVLFTLCLEKTITFTCLANTPRYQMLTAVSDWLLPLRIRTASGAKVHPERVTGLAALDRSWSVRGGTITKYAHSGFDLLSLYKNQATTLQITYARGPVALTLSGSPEIPLRFQPLLIDGAIPFLRAKEGQQEWEKTLPMWGRFQDGIQECAEKVRARNRELAYDAMPPELKRYDLSRAKAS